MAYRLTIESYSELVSLDEQEAYLLLDLIKVGVENFGDPKRMDKAIEIRDGLEGVIHRGKADWSEKHI